MKRTVLILAVLVVLFLSPSLATADEEPAKESQKNLTAEDRKILDMLELLEMLELLDNMEEVAALEDTK